MRCHCPGLSKIGCSLSYQKMSRMYIWQCVRILLGTVIDSAKVNNKPLSTVFLLNQNNSLKDGLYHSWEFGTLLFLFHVDSMNLLYYIRFNWSCPPYFDELFSQMCDFGLLGWITKNICIFKILWYFMESNSGLISLAWLGIPVDSSVTKLFATFTRGRISPLCKGPRWWPNDCRDN